MLLKTIWAFAVQSDWRHFKIGTNDYTSTIQNVKKKNWAYTHIKTRVKFEISEHTDCIPSFFCYAFDGLLCEFPRCNIRRGI